MPYLAHTERPAAMAKTGNAASRQFEIDGANHFHTEHDLELLETITAWLTDAAGNGQT